MINIFIVYEIVCVRIQSDGHDRVALVALGHISPYHASSSTSSTPRNRTVDNFVIRIHINGFETVRARTDGRRFYSQNERHIRSPAVGAFDGNRRQPSMNVDPYRRLAFQYKRQC
ncbi:hypothetical protein EVAR_62727_1 [Eumeta japonica]|uniref:Uncharacterized protein n=1 Tax=Eumeta variegata TaxID=151549 RepID=A0A4C1ZII8_EUMVA|nr:hypothetical protein EVAR_62727_1 [Eumeta japonica]